VNTRPPSVDVLHHHPRPMRGRDTEEAYRVSTPLELLFDLTFATSFSFAASQLASALAGGQYAAAWLGFGFASAAICWAWSNFSWFSSAYDTDDWIFRVVTMVQMIGVLVLAIGLPRMFASVERGEHLDNSIIVLGYVIMRVALVFQWLRAANQDPARRRACLTYAIATSIAQVGWVAQIVTHFPPGVTLLFGGSLVTVEFLAPVLAERTYGGTPWHADHIAERYSLFAIIALGEGVVGTVAALSAVVEQQGWTLDAALVGIAGTGITFAMWWLYNLLPSAQFLRRHRDRAFVWGFGQMMVVTSVVSIGAGLRVAAYVVEHKANISPFTTVMSVAVPVGLFLGLMYALYYYLVRHFHLFQLWLLVATAAVMVVTFIAARSGISMARCLVILMLAPTVTVVGYELLGYRHHMEALTGTPRAVQ
jgi:low temperature requirement protein LtrA